MNIKRIYHRAILATLLSATLTACSSSDPSPNTPAELNWMACKDAAAPFECARLKVPMDHRQTDGEQIEIAIIRRPATGSDRKGSLFVNFGGASGSGVKDAQLLLEETDIPDSILSAYDIVGFDPRGAGDSTPVDCSDTGDSDFDPYPVNADEVARLHTDYSQFSTACAAKYGDYLQHLGSLNIVRDMDLIRIALGDEKVNFLAYSFASRVAALYLQEFPETSGRMVLDGSVSPDSSLRIALSDPLPLTQAALLSILEECKTNDPDCDAGALIDALANKMNTLAASDTEASKNELESVLTTLHDLIEDPEYGRMFWSQVVDYINNTAEPMPENPDDADDDEPDNSEGEQDAEGGDDGRTVETALLCADDSFRPDVGSLVSALAEFNVRSDIFAEDSVSEFARCAGWPDALAPLERISTNTAPVSIVIGGTNDAVAPIALSEEMASAIGAVFVRSDHSGHISLFTGKSDCVDEVVEVFFLDGITPAVSECLR